MKLNKKGGKKPFSTQITPEAEETLKALCDAFNTTQTEIINQLITQYGRRALKRKENGK